METVIFDESPLADYLKDEGEEREPTWAAADSDVDHPESPPDSPSFAPLGRPMVKPRFRNKIPAHLSLDIPRKASLQNRYSRAVTSSIDRADKSKFLEHFRYTIVASQLLSGHSVLAQHGLSQGNGHSQLLAQPTGVITTTGAVVTVAGALLVAWSVSWLLGGGFSHLTKRRVLLLLVLLAASAVLFHAYIRRQWLRYVRDQALAEVTAFVSNSQDYDSAASAAVTLVQEVELVSRGYRISAPLPPISRLEDRSQTRRCVRLRKALKACFVDIIKKYGQLTTVMKGFSDQLDLEKYYDVYDISDLDISDALEGFPHTENDEAESLRTLKVAAARFHTLRKIFLCSLLALGASGDNSDFLLWTTVAEGLRALNESTKQSFERLRSILGEQGSFPNPPTPKVPLTPGREKWQSQLRKLNSLSTGIRGLQAKLTLLREESDQRLNEADDVAELGTNLMAQYESIGQDLKMLMQAWEEGKAALASGIDRNEKRLSSMSIMFSPTTSLSGLTTVEEGGSLEALKALNGESSSSWDLSSGGEPESEEVFEAVAMPRPRSIFTREERIVKMKEERDRREALRERAEANKGMLRELEMVINLRPKGRTNPTAGRASL